MGELDIDTALEWRGRTVVDRSGEKIGTLAEIYLDEDERPNWASVRTGLLGTRENLVPLREARPEADVLRLPFSREQVAEAPSVDADVQLTEDEEQQLYRHYSERPEAGRATASDDAMTRSEEEVHIRKRPRERGRARLKKYVVTDYVEKKVPVQREEVRVDYEPSDDT